MKILHLANGQRLKTVWTDAFVAALREYGELTLEENGIERDDDAVAALARGFDLVIVGWDARPLPVALAADRGDIRFVCSYSGTIRNTVPVELVEAGIPIANWGDHPANGVAEGAMTLLLSVMKEVPRLVASAREGGWGIKGGHRGTLVGTRVGLYGCGVIGRRFVELIRPFGPELRVFDPYAESVPEGCERVDSLDALAATSEVLVVHAGLSDETTGSVTAAHLARLPDGGIVINTARGAILDQQALFAELSSGRLRAGLDVLEPDYVDPDHPVRQWPNCLLSFHQAEQWTWPPRPGLDPMQQRCVDNVARFARGETPEWLFDVDRYHRST